ncbi:putative integral membrane protein [Theileria parva strain Muguga]|uniref:Uncharacterized protein n=1 Tax=Theileria parva TaxID=5875 RepID=Q4MYH2_THEPA|nr:putative integral membrane protein [Theileria parva strain Muguga]EAN30710.1 putative integral membrane protein [Theileria parva strain Muguga]|eukprot:XP_762993.1 hypothetical protein [Theileria parva strain Muguga]
MGYYWIIDIMNLCVLYTYLILFVIIGYIHSADKYPYQASGNDGNDGNGESDGDEEENFDVIVRGIENILEEQDNYDNIETNIESILEDDGLQSESQPIPIHPQPILQPQTLTQPVNYYGPPPQPQPIIQPQPLPIHPQPLPIHPIHLTQPVVQQIGQYPHYYPIQQSIPRPIVPPYHPYGPPQSVPIPVGQIRLPVPTIQHPPSILLPILPRIATSPGFRPMGLGQLQPNVIHPGPLTQFPTPHGLQPGAFIQPVGPVVPQVEDQQTVQQTIESVQPDQSDQPSHDSIGHVAEGGLDKDKECKEIKLMKMDPKGNLVTIEYPEYRILWKDENTTKMTVNCFLEEIHCDDKCIWKHKEGKPRPKKITHNIKDNTITIICRGVCILVKNVSGTWEEIERRLPKKITFYTTDEQGNLDKLPEYYHKVDVSSSGSIKYILGPSSRCSRIDWEDKKLWERADDETYPQVVCFDLSMNLIIYFDTFVRVYGNKRGRYRQIFTKKNVRGFED